MKHKMPKRKLLNKISSFLRSGKSKNSNHSENRFARKLNNLFANSNKVGAGEVTARRSLPNNILHKRNHRSNKLINTEQPKKLSR